MYQILHQKFIEIKTGYKALLDLNPSKDDQLVFTFEEERKKYNSNFYHEAFTEGRASHEEIDAVLKEMEETRSSFEFQIRIWTVIHFILHVFWALLHFVAFYWVNTLFSPRLDSLLGGGMLIDACCTFKVKSLKEERNCKLGTIMVRQNRSFLPRGLRWHISCENASQVKLSKEYQIQNDDPEFNEGFSSSGTVIVFYFDPSSKIFDSDFYSSELTDGRAGVEEIKDTLSELVSFRKVHQLRRIAHILIPPACFGISYLFVDPRFDDDERHSPEYLLFLAYFFLLQGVLLWVNLLLFYCLKRHILSKCQAETNRLNERFASRGLKWQLPNSVADVSIRWVELVKEYRIHNLARTMREGIV